MEKLPTLLSKSMQDIISSQELSSWTIHNGHSTVITIRFKIDQTGGTPRHVDNSTATYHKSSPSRLARDNARAFMNRKDTVNCRITRSKAKDNEIEQARRSSDNTCDMISALSPEAAEFIPAPSPPLIPVSSPEKPPPPVGLQCMSTSLTECLPVTDGLITTPNKTVTADLTQAIQSSGSDVDPDNQAVPYTGKFSALMSDEEDGSTSSTEGSDSEKSESDVSDTKSEAEQTRPYIRRYDRVEQHCIMCNNKITRPKIWYFWQHSYGQTVLANLCTYKPKKEGSIFWRDSKCVELFNPWPDIEKQKYYFSNNDYCDKDEDGNPVTYEPGASAPWDSYNSLETCSD